MRRTLVAASALAVLAWIAPEERAHACGGGMSYGMDGLAELAVIAGTGVAILGATDATYATYDIVHARPTYPPRLGWAKGESYVTVPQSVIGVVVLAAIDRESFPIAFAVSSIPFELSIHGLYLAAPQLTGNASSNYGNRWEGPVGAVGALDATMGIFDLVALGKGEKMDEVYGLCEMIATFPQVLFGVVYAADQGGSRAATALSMSALPALLATHGFLTLAIHSNPTEADKTAASKGGLASVRPLSWPTHGGSMIGLAGMF